MVLKRASEQLLGLPARVAINITDVNDKIYAAARAAGRPVAASSPTGWPPRTAPTPTGSGLGRPDAEPLASRDDPRDRRADRAADRGGRGLRDRRRRRLLQRPGLSAVRRALGPAPRRADRRLAASSPARASARRSTSRSGRPTSRTRTRPGTRPGGEGGPAGTSSARRWRARSSARTSTCTAAAST